MKNKVLRLFHLLLIGLSLGLALGQSHHAQAANGCSPNAMPVQRWVIPGTGHIVERFSTLRDVHGNPIQVMFAPQTFRVVEVRDCSNSRDGYVWVRIDYGGGLEGWALEGEVFNPLYGSHNYWIAPGDAPANQDQSVELSAVDDDHCIASESLTGRLFTGSRGRIAQVYSTLRPLPGQPGRRIFNPAPHFTVKDVWCVYGERWLHITYDPPLNRTGWALESSVYDYRYGWNNRWLVPE